MDTLTQFVDFKQLTQVVVIPALLWSAGFIKTHIGLFLKNREMKRALAVYTTIQEGVGAIWDEIVQPVKAAAPGVKLTSEVRNLAMEKALEKITALAEAKGQEKWIPPMPELKLKIEQVIKDRKNGVFSPMLPVE